MNDNNQYGGDFIDFNNQYNYVLQWLYESVFARNAYRALLFRTSLAKEGKPSKNLYQEMMTTNAGKITDKEKKQKYMNMCACLPTGTSFALANAVDNRANQLAGGVDSYECEVNDPYMVIDDETEDLLAAKCQQDYVESGLKYMASQFSDDLTWTGMTAVLVKYDPENDNNKIYRINPKNTWFDTKYSSLGQERFRGYSTMISWAKLLKMIEHDGDEINPSIEVNSQSLFDDKGQVKKDAKVTKTKIETLNGLSVYIQDLNKLATSPQLQEVVPNTVFGEYLHDLNDCYNLGWYHTFANDAEARTKSGYNGDDVELTVMYDLSRKIEFKIINRRYIISANSKCFRRKIPYEIINPVTQTIKITKQEYCLNCPLIFKFERRNMDMKPYPQAPVFPLLDEHDKLCAQIAKREHVTNILSLLRIVANSADAESIGDTLNIMGVILDDIQGDIQTIALNYNYEPIDSEINRLEALIKTRLKGYDDFDAMQAMGDRASAAESGMATGAIAQGLSTLQQTVMELYADIARQCIGNRVTYSKNGNFRVWNGGDYSSLSVQEMSLLTIIDVKPKLAKKVQERAIATNALSMVGSLGQTGLVNAEGVAYLMEQAMFGQMPRGLAARFVNKPNVTPETVAANAQQGSNMAQALQQNQIAYEQNPTAYEALDVTQSMTPDQIDDVISMYSDQVNNEDSSMVDETMAEDIAAQGATPVDTTGGGVSFGDIGIGSEAAGDLANSGIAY